MDRVHDERALHRREGAQARSRRARAPASRARRRRCSCPRSRSRAGSRRTGRARPCAARAPSGRSRPGARAPGCAAGTRALTNSRTVSRARRSSSESSSSRRRKSTPWKSAMGASAEAPRLARKRRARRRVRRRALGIDRPRRLASGARGRCERAAARTLRSRCSLRESCGELPVDALDVAARRDLEQPRGRSSTPLLELLLRRPCAASRGASSGGAAEHASERELARCASRGPCDRSRSCFSRSRAARAHAALHAPELVLEGTERGADAVDAFLNDAGRLGHGGSSLWMRPRRGSAGCGEIEADGRIRRTQYNTSASARQRSDADDHNTGS